MDPVNAKFVCGAECGLASVGTLSGGVEHWAAVTGTPTVETSGPSSMRSPRCIRINPSASTERIRHVFAAAVASPATVVTRFALYFASLPTATYSLYTCYGAASLGVVYHQSSGTIRCANVDASSYAASGVAVTTGEWYVIDVMTVHGATYTVDARVNGTDCAQFSAAGSASNVGTVQWGDGLVSNTADIYYDDIIVSGTSTDYPIGDGTVVGLYPSGDRANAQTYANDDSIGHYYSATSDFNKTTGVALAAQQSETTSWQSLANPLSTSIGSNFIRDLAGASTEHLVWELDNLPAEAVSINGVMCVATTHSASATTNNFTLQVQSAFSAGDITATLSADLSEATITVPTLIVPKYSSVYNIAWTVSGMNATRLRFSSTDANPDVYCDGACLEVDIVMETGGVDLEGRANEADAARATVTRSAGLTARSPEADATRGGLVRTRALTARADEADNARASPSRARALTARADESDNARGDLSISTLVSLEGKADEADGARGALSTTRALAGRGPEADNALGAPTRTRALTARADEADNARATATSTRLIAGRADESDNARGDLSIGGLSSFDGHADAADDAHAALSTARPVAGQAGEADAARGTLARQRTLGGRARTAADTRMVSGLLFDDVSTSSALGQSSVTWQHTIGAGADRLLVVGVVAEVTSTTEIGDVTSVTYDGVALTKALDASVTGEPWSLNTELWYMLDDDLPTAGTYDVVVNVTNTPAETLVTATSYANVVQGAPEASNHTESTADASVFTTNVVTVSEGAWIIDAIGIGAGLDPGVLLTPDSPQVQRASFATGGSAGAGLGVSTRFVGTPATTSTVWRCTYVEPRYAHVVAVWAPVLVAPFPIVRAFDGPASEADNATATLIRARAVAGRADSATNARGDLSIIGGVVGLDGPAATADDAHAALSTVRPVTGRADEAARARATITIARGLTGRSDEADAARATPSRERAFAGRTDEADAARATATRTAGLSGRSDEADAARATLSRERAFTGRSDEADASRATVLRAAGLTGRADEADDARGDFDITGEVVLTGRASTASSAHAALSKLVDGFQVARALVGRTPEADAARATATRLAGLVGRADTADGARGDLTIGHGVLRDLDGHADEADAARATPTRIRAFAGRSDEADAARATPSRSRALAARAATATAAQATTTRAAGLTGRAATATGARGDLSIAGQANLDGLAPEAATARGSLTAARSLAAAAPTATAARSAVTRQAGLSARSGTSSGARGDLSISGEAALAGQASAATGARGALTVVRAVTGRASTASGTRGLVVRTRAFQARAATATSARAPVVRAVGIIGTAATANDAHAVLALALLFDGYAAEAASATAAAPQVISSLAWRTVLVATQRYVALTPSHAHRVLVASQAYQARSPGHAYRVLVDHAADLALVGRNVR